ncbi:hypothetical protein [[Clostridium] polysaccharolyticum]|uniref:Tetratricopeptide repeat-containing protein n=1 Tax=[Clostridium] polysaccharolyticum TaxID=29364 RepID=A0A1H9Y6B7_9FIRM|nr:hypothetical protein [[Clostridium] polysaccharolyticum]SES64444.1 hypothetical protein SAMN04487772_101171 [[Clostridium] polysaccharolyticum]
MGKFILCSGTRAKEPLRIEITDTILYTIEELCFYLYQHIYLITDEFFSESVIGWIEKEVELPELAKKLRELNRSGRTLKDKVISILCSTDYYTEKEMKELIVVMDKIDGLPLIKRRKMKADIYVQYQRYLFAAKEYEAILESREASILTAGEYGNLLHNYAFVLLNIGSLKDAAQKMKEAYRSNQNPESLKSYLLILRMLGNENAQEQQKDLAVPSEMLEMIEAIMKDAESMESAHSCYQAYQKLLDSKEKHDAIKFYRDLETMLEKWIREYRNKVS